MATKKFYRITYREKSMEVEEFPVEQTDALKRVNARCISRLPDGPVITEVTEISIEIPIARKPVEKWINPAGPHGSGFSIEN